MDVDWKHVGEDALATAAGLLLAGGVIAVGYVASAYFIGVPSYLGLTREQVAAVRDEVDKRCTILSRVCGTDWLGKPFCRGIYLGGACNVPLYYHWGPDSYSLYPLLWAEYWNTTPDLLGLTGHLVYPTPGPAASGPPPSQPGGLY